MEENRSLFVVFKTEEEKNAIILDNVVLMLSHRIYVDKAGEKHPLLTYDDALKKARDVGNNSFTVKADTGDTYAIKIIYQKILTTGKQSVVSEFIKEYESDKKIIIANDYNNKIIDAVTRQGVQLFKERTLMSDLLTFRDQPTFELLSPKEMEQVKTEYNVTPYTLPKILRTDPVVKYFGLKKGDIIRIISPSPTAGMNTSYQVVA